MIYRLTNYSGPFPSCQITLKLCFPHYRNDDNEQFITIDTKELKDIMIHRVDLHKRFVIVLNNSGMIPIHIKELPKLLKSIGHDYLLNTYWKVMRKFNVGDLITEGFVVYKVLDITATDYVLEIFDVDKRIEHLVKKTIQTHSLEVIENICFLYETGLDYVVNVDLGLGESKSVIGVIEHGKSKKV